MAIGCASWGRLGVNIVNSAYGDAALNPPVWGVTVEMAVRYHAPVPLGVELTARGRITRDRSRTAEASTELYLPKMVRWQ